MQYNNNNDNDDNDNNNDNNKHDNKDNNKNKNIQTKVLHYYKGREVPFFKVKPLCYIVLYHCIIIYFNNSSNNK